MSETQQHWATQGLNFYVGAKLAWDASLDVDALLAEYYRRFYGRAEAPMRRYWECWEDAMIAHREAGGLRLPVAAHDDAGAGGDLRAPPHARRSSWRAATREKVAKRVALARLGLDFTEAWTRMRAHGDRGEWALALAAGEEAIRRIAGDRGTEPQAFFISLAVEQTEAAILPYRRVAAASR